MKRLNPTARRGCLFAAVLALTVCAAPSAGWSQTEPRAKCKVHLGNFVKSLIKDWADALKDSKPDHTGPVVGKYAPGATGAILLPTCSATPAIGTAAITAYFGGEHGFLSSAPEVTEIGEPTVGGDCDASIFGSGLYTFKLNAVDKTVRARYSYIFETRGQPAQWLIVQHHSSLAPKVPDNDCPH